MVFVELKKKYEGIVYKRRVEIPEFPAMDWLCAGGALPPIDTREKEEQPNYRRIGKEIDDFRFRYGDAAILPRVYLSYEREAYAPVSTSGEDIRITFDTNILARDYDLSLRSEAYGEPVLDPDFTVMEVKIPKFGSMPIWLCRKIWHILSKPYKRKKKRYYRRTTLCLTVYITHLWGIRPYRIQDFCFLWRHHFFWD